MAKYGWNCVFVGGKWNKIYYIYRKQWYENYNNYIKLSIVFQPMIIFLRNKDI
jgi:hypothetical protein